MTKVISPKSFLVDGIPCHVRDLHLRHSVNLLEEDFDGTPSETEVESLVCDTEDAESDNSSEEEAEAEPLSMSLCRSVY